MNFSEYVGHLTIFICMFPISRCLIVGLGFGLDSVSVWLVVMHTYLYNFHALEISLPTIERIIVLPEV